MLNTCDGFDIKLEPYLEKKYIKITVYRNGHVARSECRTNSQCEDG